MRAGDGAGGERPLGSLTPAPPAPPLCPPPLSLQLGTGGEEDSASAKALAAEVRLLRTRRVLRTLGLVQDLADLLQVLADVRESTGLMGHAAVLAAAGLVSGGVSAYKNWQKVAER